MRPDGVFFSRELREFVLPYEVVRRAKSPDDTLLAFCQSTYDVAADLGDWDRTAPDWPAGVGR